MAALTILHISDLHRDPNHPVSNDCLLNSLERDRDRYRNEQPPIGDPDFVVVSGDLVQGIPADCPTPMDHLAAQYEQAESFLSRLAESFLRGDRRRVVIVPGNHDVSFYHARHSLRPVVADPKDPASREVLDGYVSQLHRPDTCIRWSWRDLCFYEVANKALYFARVDAFCTFYRQFYRGERTYSLKPEEQYDIFDYPEFRIAFAAFNSCHNNDPLNRRGAFHPDCLAAATRSLRSRQFAGRLLVAVWHHGTSGAPNECDYLDTDSVQTIIDSGFSIALHGHQHESRVIDERFRFGSERRMTVIGAGSLCAGPGGLRAGHRRSYNVIQSDTDRLEGTLHLRTMLNDAFDQPLWGRGQWAATGDSFVLFTIQSPAKEPPASTADMLRQAEGLVRAQQYKKAIPLLRTLGASEPLARPLLLECYFRTDETKAMVDEFYPPMTLSEATLVADALWAEKDRDKLRELLASELVGKSDDPAAEDICKRYSRRVAS